MDENNINKYLHEFYTHFGHNMTIEDIESVNLSSLPTNQNIFSSFFNLLNSYQNNENTTNEDMNNENTNNENTNNLEINNNSSDADIEDNIQTSEEKWQ